MRPRDYSLGVAVGIAIVTLSLIIPHVEDALNTEGNPEVVRMDRNNLPANEDHLTIFRLMRGEY